MTGYLTLRRAQHDLMNSAGSLTCSMTSDTVTASCRPSSVIVRSSTVEQT